MVTFADGATIAQASPPDMRLPIALALAWPDRLPARAAGAGLVDGEHVGVRCRWTTRRSRRSGWRGSAGEAGGVVPALYNAANEEAVAAFVAGRLSFRAIVRPRRAYPRRRAGPRRTDLRRGRAGRGEMGPGARPRRHLRRPTAERDPSHDPRDRRLRARSAVLDRLPRARALHLGPAVRHARAAVHGRLRPDDLVAQPRRDRVRHQGRAAGRLHPDRRDDPAGRGGREQARDPHAQLHRRGPRAGAQRRPAHRRRPRLLRQAVVAARHRHVRRAVPQPDPGGAVLHRSSSSAFGVPESTTTLARVPGCVLPAGAATAAARTPARSRSPRDGAALRGRDAGLRPARRRARRRRPGCEPGDTILAIDGEAVSQETDDRLGAGAGRHPGAAPSTPVVLTIERDGDGSRTSPSRRSRTASTVRRTATRPPSSATSASARRRPTSGSRSPPSRRSSATIVVKLRRQAGRDPAAHPAAVRRGVPRRGARPAGPDRRRRRQPDLRRGVRPRRTSPPRRRSATSSSCSPA